MDSLLVSGTRNLHYWQYFVALEADLAATARYVEPTSANMACHSVEFARILLTAGSEVDVLCKVLCQEHGLRVSPVNINGYRAAITAQFPGSPLRPCPPTMAAMGPQQKSELVAQLQRREA